MEGCHFLAIVAFLSVAWSSLPYLLPSYLLVLKQSQVGFYTPKSLVFLQEKSIILHPVTTNE